MRYKNDTNWGQHLGEWLIMNFQANKGDIDHITLKIIKQIIKKHRKHNKKDYHKNEDQIMNFQANERRDWSYHIKNDKTNFKEEKHYKKL